MLFLALNMDGTGLLACFLFHSGFGKSYFWEGVRWGYHLPLNLRHDCCWIVWLSAPPILMSQPCWTWLMISCFRLHTLSFNCFNKYALFNQTQATHLCNLWWMHKICPQETRLLLAYRGQILTKASRLRNILSRNTFFIIAMSQKYQPACPSTKYVFPKYIGGNGH